MILYHGSNVDIAQIDLSCARKGMDFGPGFYLNANKDQALKMGVRTSNLLDSPLFRLLNLTNPF